ncbi:sugar phosphate isomerase/epimerase family protein [Bacteroidota bacterium]
MRVGIDNYSLYPLKLDPIQTLEWAKRNNAEGVAFSGLDEKSRVLLTKEYLIDLKQFADSNNLFIEWGGGQHIPWNMDSWNKKDIFDINRRGAEEASLLDIKIIRSCSGGLMRWNPENPKTEILLKDTAAALLSQKQMIRDNNVILAIETHFEFTTFELIRIFEMCGAEPGEYLGICLDTMNLLTMLEEPVAATERILPWVVSTHIKDGALLLSSDGLTTFPVKIGGGVVKITEIIQLLKTVSDKINLSIEDHGGSFLLPIFNRTFLSEFPDLTIDEYTDLFRLSEKSKSKISDGQIKITERSVWPSICENRIQHDIVSLKSIVSGIKE